jgi:hypothetical protein
MSPSNQHWLLFGTLHPEVGRLVQHIKTARGKLQVHTDAGNLGTGSQLAVAIDFGSRHPPAVII